MLEKLVVLIVFRLLRIKGRNLFIKCVPPSGVKNMNKDEYRPPLTDACAMIVSREPVQGGDQPVQMFMS